MLVIADAARPVALAGVMGGLHSEVTSATRNVLLESARFFVELIPSVSAVQRAALKELLIAVALILVLRLMPRVLLHERIPRAPRA